MHYEEIILSLKKSSYNRQEKIFLDYRFLNTQSSIDLIPMCITRKSISHQTDIYLYLSMIKKLF
jgi:hypothetical protein